MADRGGVRWGIASLVLASGLLAACTSAGPEGDDEALDGDDTVLPIGAGHELGAGRAVTVHRFVDDVALADDVYDLDGTRYVGAEVELCGLAERRRREFWRLRTADGGAADEAPLPPQAPTDAVRALDVYAAPVEGCLSGWIWFTVDDASEAARLEWAGADGVTWDVSG